MTTRDDFALDRFVSAQDEAGSYDAAVRELAAGHKRGHWMWFVFPQIAGLGRSATAMHFGISGLAEARAYLAHPVLGPRLVRCAGVLAGLAETDPVRILGSVDAMKLRSSMTLFGWAAPEEPMFGEVLARLFGGRADDATLAALGEPRGGGAPD